MHCTYFHMRSCILQEIFNIKQLLLILITRLRDDPHVKLAFVTVIIVHSLVIFVP